MQFSEVRKWQRNGDTIWKLELLEYLRSSPSSLGNAYSALGQVEKAGQHLVAARAIGKEIRDPNIVRIATENLEKLDNGK